MDIQLSTSTEQYSSNNAISVDGKKRKADGPNETNQPEKPTEAKKARKGTFATGFLIDGTWVEDMKFACFPCKRGHRTDKCAHANEGIPVAPAIRGRPAAGGPERGDPKCECKKREQCACLHQTYILGKIMVGTQEKWKIQKAVMSDGKGRIIGTPLSTIPGQLGQFWIPQNTY